MSSTEARRASLQRRLALELSIALGLLLVALFIALNHLIDRELHERMDAALLDRANTIAAFLQAHPEPEGLQELGRLMPEYELPAHTDFFEVRNDRGEIQVRSASSAARALTPPPSTPMLGAPLFFDLRLPDAHAGRGVALRLLSAPATPEQPATLIVASEREQHDLLERRIHNALLAGIALALLLAVSIALLAVRRGLVPLQEFRRRIAAAESTPRPATLSTAELPRELEPVARALDGAFARLHALLESERRFSRDVAHELRTPLAEIRATIETAEREPGDEAARRAAFSASIDAVERMQRAIDTLLLLARQEAGLAQPAIDPLDLPPLLASLSDSLAPSAKARRIELRRELPPHLWIRCDAGALERIASNLLRNAIEYAPPGSTVNLRLEDAGAHLRLCVSNLAPELGTRDLAHLGERFWRKSSSGGTATHSGLGLALARALAQGLHLELVFSLRDGCLMASLGPLRKL